MQKIKMVKDDFDGQLTSFLLNISFPCLIFNSMVAESFSVEVLEDCAIVLVLSIGVCAIQFVLGHITYLLMGKSGSGRITRYGMTFVHYAFMGVPVIEALFGAEGLFYYSVFQIPVRILYFGTNKELLSPPGMASGSPRIKEKVKQVLSNPCLIAVVVGLVFWILGWKLPSAVSSCVTSLSKTCSPLGLILCGLALGKFDFRKLLNIRYLRLPVIRTVILPAFFFVLTRFLISAGVNPVIANIAMIYTALPVPSLLAAFTMKYDSDQEIQFEAAGSTLIATILSTVTVPIWYMILQ